VAENARRLIGGAASPKDILQSIARNLSRIVGDQASLKGDASHWLCALEYGYLRYRLDDAHAAAEAALIEACRR
jgi:hypothetical protein